MIFKTTQINVLLRLHFFALEVIQVLIFKISKILHIFDLSNIIWKNIQHVTFKNYKFIKTNSNLQTYKAMFEVCFQILTAITFILQTPAHMCFKGCPSQKVDPKKCVNAKKSVCPSFSWIWFPNVFKTYDDKCKVKFHGILAQTGIKKIIAS